MLPLQEENVYKENFYQTLFHFSETINSVSISYLLKMEMTVNYCEDKTILMTWQMKSASLSKVLLRLWIPLLCNSICLLCWPSKSRQFTKVQYAPFMPDNILSWKYTFIQKYKIDSFKKHVSKGIKIQSITSWLLWFLKESVNTTVTLCMEFMPVKWLQIKSGIYLFILFTLLYFILLRGLYREPYHGDFGHSGLLSSQTRWNS